MKKTNNKPIIITTIILLSILVFILIIFFDSVVILQRSATPKNSVQTMPFLSDKISISERLLNEIFSSLKSRFNVFVHFLFLGTKESPSQRFRQKVSPNILSQSIRLSISCLLSFCKNNY